MAVALRLDGHDARTTRELRTETASDAEHLALAYQNGWIFVTHNIAHFALLHDAWLRWSELWGVTVSHPGILALATGPSPEHLAALIAERVNAVPAMEGQLWIWRSDHGWQQRA